MSRLRFRLIGYFNGIEGLESSIFIRLMAFFDWLQKNYSKGWKKSLDWRGNSSRGEYWSYFAIQAFIGIASALIYRGSNDFWKELILPTFTLYWLGSIFSLLTIQLRRIRDSLGSGWWWLVNLVPYIGNIIIFMICLMPSKEVKN